MGWSRSRAAFLAGSGACALLWAAGAPGPVGPSVSEAVSPALELVAGAASRGREPTRVASGGADRGAQSAGRRADAAPFATGSAQVRGHSPWWLEPGPAVEIRIGAQVAHATPARLDLTALEQALAGDWITVALPDVGALDVVVQRVTSPRPGVRLLQGHLAGPAESYAVTFTVGPVLAFANVTTPTGTWIAEFENGAGWILYDDLADRLVDYRHSDAQIPPRHGQAG